MKKKRKYDEYYTNGLLEVGRFENIVSIKNNLSEEMAKENREKLAGEYDSKKNEIDQQIKEICEKISICNPLRLLECATSIGMMSLINAFSEFQLSREQSLSMRAIEYIQSILISQSSKYDNAMHDDQSKLYMEILAQIEELYRNVQMFYLYWAAKAMKLDEELSDEDVKYIIEAQLMGNVRGDRYQFQQLENLEYLILPHTEVMETIYGVSAKDFIIGLEKLEYSLSSGKLDAIKVLFNEFEKFQELSEGKNLSETEELFSKIEPANEDVSGKAFGFNLYDIEKVTGWSKELINSLSYSLDECEEFLKEGEFSGWPIVDLPVQKKPFIKIGDRSYCFDYYNLFDNIYRILQKDIKRHNSSYTTTWSKIQQEASEALVQRILINLLPGCESFIGNYYPKNTSLKQMDENDVLVLYDDIIIVAEVKAGSFTYTPAITDYEAHKKSFFALIEKADYQCERTLEFINKNDHVKFYDDCKVEKVCFDRNDYRKIYTLCITVDNFNAFEAKIEKMNFLQINNGSIAIGIDDLQIYEKYFDNPLYFFHFLAQRKEATGIETLMLNDELDHLGMYITHNLYGEYVKEFGDCSTFSANGYRQELDTYFASLHISELECEKPVQIVPDRIKQILSFIENNKMNKRVAFSNFILSFATDAKEEFCDGIEHLLKRQNEIKRMVPVITFGDVRYGCFVKQKHISETKEEKRLEYMYANMLKVNAPDYWYIILEYDERHGLIDVEYRRLFLSDIDENGYDKAELLEVANQMVEKRTRLMLEQKNMKKIYPNDKCPCGSGLKYKKCCNKKA